MFWLPTMGHGSTIALRPAPIDATVQGVSQLAQFDLQRGLARKVRGGGENPGDQERRVHDREFAMPCARAARHVEEVKIEAPVTCRVGTSRLIAVPKKAQCLKSALHGVLAIDPTSLDAYGIDRQREADDSNARRGSIARAVGDEAVPGARRPRKIVERGSLHLLEHDRVVAASDLISGRISQRAPHGPCHASSGTTRRSFARATTWSRVNPNFSSSTSAGA